MLEPHKIRLQTRGEPMPLYDLRCNTCGLQFEAMTTIDNRNGVKCSRCGAPCTCLMSQVFVARSDSPWYGTLNGIVNDLEMAETGRMRKVETKGDYVDYINHLYSDPEPAVQKLRVEYLDRAGVKASKTDAET